MGNSAGAPFVPLPELVAAVTDGSRVGIGGALLTRLPLAALHALAARRPRDLTYVSWGGGIPLEILLGAGAVSRIVFCSPAWTSSGWPRCSAGRSRKTG